MTKQPSDKTCRICNSPATLFFQEARTFYKCPECRLIFSEDFPGKVEEERHYKTQWESTDPGFWSGQVDVLVQLINNYLTPKHLLDFGSGSGAMTQEFLKRGYDITALEPMIHGYLKDQSYPVRFDVVIAVEVLEHLPNPWNEIREIEKVLAPGGIVIFSTLLTNAFIDRPDAVDHFKSWWYKDDPTHISFFCNHVLSKMADIGNYDIDIIGDKVFVLKRTP
jgi:SAM-dependent methyltransferase